MDVREKVVAITGAARGLGQEFARSLAAGGARIVAADISDCTETLSLVTRDGGEAIAARLDVTDARSATEMVEAAVRAFGRLDGLVNNAALYGALHGGRFDAIDETEWDACMAVNVKGIWNCCKAAVPAMREAGGGSIVNIASLAATYGMPFGLHYTTSKAAVIGLTRGLAREYGPNGIRVNCIVPTMIGTSAARDPKRVAREIELTLLGRLGTPREVANVVAFLASDLASYVTGQALHVNGGQLMP